MKTITGMLGVAGLLAAAAVAQDRPKYLDVMSVQVKPERSADFMAIARKMADANRRHKGDRWIAYGTEYGEHGRYTFVSPRRNYADIDRNIELFRKAMQEAYGTGLAKLMQEAYGCLQSSRGELQALRWDLSARPPESDEEIARLLGTTRWIRTTAVHVRRDKRQEFERFAKSMAGKAQHTTFVAQPITGQRGLEYRLTVMQPSLAAFDEMPAMQDILKGRDWEEFTKLDSEAVLNVESAFARVMPEISNPPETVVNISRDYWTPRPAATAARKAKPAPAPATGTKKP